MDLLHVPVVASGGIADGRGMAAAISLGAEAIEMGSIFMAAEETVVHPNVKEAVVNAGDMSTVITGFSTGEPCRQIKNPLSDKLTAIEENNTKEAAALKLKDAAESSLKKAMMEGDMVDGAVMAGQIVPLIQEIKPVSKIMDEVLEQAKKCVEEMRVFHF